MRIDTEICENFVGCYDEARGMALGKRQILERESSKVLSFMQRKLVVFGLWFVFGILLSFFAEYSEAVLPIVCIIFVASMVYVAANLLEIYKSYRAKKEARFIDFRSIHWKIYSDCLDRYTNLFFLPFIG